VASSDLNHLFNEALGFAEYMLVAHGEFIPFGVSMDPTGKIAQVAGHLGAEHPPPADMVDLLQASFKEAISTSSVRAAGVCLDVLAVPPGSTEKSDAVCIQLAHSSGETVTVYVPYAKQHGEYTFGQVFATAGESFWLAEP
jgi:hypothetical protein